MTKIHTVHIHVHVCICIYMFDMLVTAVQSCRVSIFEGSYLNKKSKKILKFQMLPKLLNLVLTVQEKCTNIANID